MEELKKTSGSRPQQFSVVVTALLFAAFAFQLVYVAVSLSPTIDEPDHILAGHRHWCGDFGINPEHPPLLKLLSTAPLNFMELAEPPWECGSKLTSKFDAFSYGSSFLVENGIDPILIPARLTAALMSLLLAALVFLAAWEMFGRWQALAALGILAFEPVVVGSGPLIMTDMSISATSFAVMYALYRFGKEQTWTRLAIAGVAFGFMLASKHSAVIFVGIFFAVLLLDVFFFRKVETRIGSQLVRRVAAFAGIFVIGWTILWAFYGFRYYAIPSATGPSITVADYIKENGRPESVESMPAKLTAFIGSMHLFPESYVLGMADVIAWGSRNTNLFGKTYPTGKWFYFPAAFSIKTSIVLLLLLPLGLIFAFVEREKLREVMFLLVPSVGFFIAAANSSFTTGVRHILPIYGFLIVLAAAGAVWVCGKFYYFRYVLFALLLYHVATAARTAPNSMIFANDLWGGYEKTYTVLRGGDSDQGGGIKQVNKYLAREGITDCWITGFVHPDLLKYEQPCRTMPSGLRILISRDLIDPVPPVIEGTVIVSVNDLPPFAGDEYVPISQVEPVAQIGGSMFVYQGRFEVPVVAAMSRVHRSGYFLRNKRIDEAVAEGREAVLLGPGDARTHLTLGLALVRAGQLDEARQELSMTVDRANGNPRYRNAEIRAKQELEKLR